MHVGDLVGSAFGGVGIAGRDPGGRDRGRRGRIAGSLQLRDGEHEIDDRDEQNDGREDELDDGRTRIQAFLRYWIGSLLRHRVAVLLGHSKIETQSRSTSSTTDRPLRSHTSAGPHSPRTGDGSPDTNLDDIVWAVPGCGDGDRLGIALAHGHGDEFGGETFPVGIRLIGEAGSGGHRRWPNR